MCLGYISNDAGRSAASHEHARDNQGTGEKMGSLDSRLRFDTFAFDRYPNGLCHAVVRLIRGDGEAYVGEADGSGSATGALRCAAQASLHALAAAVDASYRFELVGVKSVSAFDKIIVIVSLAARRDGPSRNLVGTFVSEGDPQRAAAVAVLNATNRLLGSAAFDRAEASLRPEGQGGPAAG